MYRLAVLLCCILNLTVATFNEREKSNLENSCSYCTALTHIAEWAKTNKLGEEYLQEQMRHMCSLAEHSYSCLKHSQQYIGLINNALDENVQDEREICQTLTGVCSSNTAVKSRNSNGFECSICHVFSRILVNRFELAGELLKKSFQSMCQSKRLSEKNQQICVDVFEKHFQETFDAMLKLLITDKLCSLTNMCTAVASNQQELTADFNGLTMENLTCSVCRSFIGFIQMGFDKANFEKVFLKTLETVCILLPNEVLKDKCMISVKEDATKFIEDFLNVFSPDVFCPMLHFC